MCSHAQLYSIHYVPMHVLRLRLMSRSSNRVRTDQFRRVERLPVPIECVAMRNLSEPDWISAVVSRSHTTEDELNVLEYLQDCLPVLTIFMLVMNLMKCFFSCPCLFLFVCASEGFPWVPSGECLCSSWLRSALLPVRSQTTLLSAWSARP